MKQNQITYTTFLKKGFQALILLFALSFYAKAQTLQVKGKITSNLSDSAVSGASIAC
jgi:hypothetical protein